MAINRLESEDVENESSYTREESKMSKLKERKTGSKSESKNQRIVGDDVDTNQNADQFGIMKTMKISSQHTQKEVLPGVLERAAQSSFSKLMMHGRYASTH